MIAKTYIALGLILVFVIGLFYIQSLLVKITNKINFLTEYRSKFIQYVTSILPDRGSTVPTDTISELYRWLTFNIDKAQHEVGTFGVGGYIAPGQLYKVDNYQFIVNTLPKLRSGSFHANEVGFVDDSLVRCIGYSTEIHEELQKEIKNPVKWLQYGTRFLIGFPVRLLNWLGIINDNTLSSITSSGLFKVISGFISLIGLISSIVTILTGWTASKGIINDFIHKLIG